MIDTHCHLDFDDFRDDRAEVIATAREGGISRIINIGIDEKTSLASLELSEQYEGLYAAIGYHPHAAREFNKKNQDSLERLAQHPRVVAIGEIGLDYYRKYAPREDQINTFRRQIGLSRALELPIVVHIREAMEDSLKILQQERAFEQGGVLHCFPGSYEDSQKAFDLNFKIAFGGTLTFKNSRAAQVAGKAPLGQIILETDAPFLTPEPLRGRRNCPQYVHHVYHKLAEIRGIDFAELEKKIDKNACELFNLA